MEDTYLALQRVDLQDTTHMRVHDDEGGKSVKVDL